MEASFAAVGVRACALAAAPRGAQLRAARPAPAASCIRDRSTSSRRRLACARAEVQGDSPQHGVSRRDALAASVSAALLGPLLAGPASAKAPQSVELTPQNFANVIAPGKRVFVEMYAPWCPFCKRLEEDWAALPQRLQESGVKDTVIARMDVDKYTDYAGRYQVGGFPTFILFEDGKPVGMHQGFVGPETLLRYASARPGKGGAGGKADPGPKLDLVLNERSQELLLDELALLRKEIGGGAGGAEAALRRIDTLEMLLGGGPPPL